MADVRDGQASVTSTLKRTKSNQNYVDSHRTLISKDKRLAICGCGNKLITYSVKTGKLLRKLEGHEADVVDFYLRKSNPLQVISADKSGVIILWDITDGTLIKKIPVSYSLSAMICHPSNDDVIFVIREVAKKKGNGESETKCTLMKIDLTAGIKERSKDESAVGAAICAITKISKSVSVSQRGNVFAYIKGSKLKIVSLNDQTKRRFGFEGKQFTCIAFHPSKMMIATGINDGKIILWSNFLDGSTPTVVQLHWHMHPVDSLTFTNDGLYLLSGGLETVLVRWQLSSLKSDFIPRLGAPIKFISLSEDDQFVLTTLTNNTVKIISLVDKKLACLLQGLAEASTIKVGMKFDPRSGCLVLPVAPVGHLQFYNPENDSVLTTFDAVGQNYIVGPKKHAIRYSQIEHFDFNYDGTWLATVERGKYTIIPEEVKLKFWRYDLIEQRYELITVADAPHDGKILCVKMRPKPEAASPFDQLVVTAGSSGKFKFWVLDSTETEDDNGGELCSWRCHSALNYGSSPCGRVAFSQDGSLLAVIYDKIITLWDPETGELRTTFYGPVLENFRDVIFGAGPSMPYLLARTTHYIFCWNLLTCSLCWSIESKVTAMTVDPLSGYFAVAAIENKGKSKVCLLDSSTSKIVLRMGRSGQAFKVKSMAFSSMKKISCKSNGRVVEVGKLYAFNSGKDIYTFSSKLEEVEEDLDKESAEDQVKTEFENIFGTLAKQNDETKGDWDAEKSTKLSPGNHSATVIRKIIGTPSHVLPSVESLCSTFFKAVTLTRVPAQREQDANVDVENSTDADSDLSESDEEADGNDKQRKEDSQEDVITNEQRQKTSEPKLLNHSMRFNWISQFVSSNYDT